MIIKEIIANDALRHFSVMNARLNTIAPNQNRELFTGLFTNTLNAKRINNVVLEVSQIGKICHRPCKIFYEVGKCIMPEQGIFAIVLKGGEIKVGDRLNINSSEEAG